METLINMICIGTLYALLIFGSLFVVYIIYTIDKRKSKKHLEE